MLANFRASSAPGRAASGPRARSCDHPLGKVKIDAAYVAVNTPIVRKQMQKAGVRLAHMLDAALGN